MSPLICFVGKNCFFWKGTQQFALFESFHKKLRFIKFPQNIPLFENFHTKSICGKISKKNHLAEKFPQQFALLENFD